MSKIQLPFAAVLALIFLLVVGWAHANTSDNSLTIVNAYLCDGFGHSRTFFSKETFVYFNVTVLSTMPDPQNVHVTVALHDVTNTPIGSDSQMDVISPHIQKNFMLRVYIPSWAFVGNAKAYINAFINSVFAPEYNVLLYIQSRGTRKPTSIIIDCSPTIIDKTGTQTTRINGRLTSGGSGVSGKTVKLYYQYASSQYGVPVGTWISLSDNILTNGTGYYEYNWNPSGTLQNGYYSIGAEFEGDSTYLESYGFTGVLLTPNLFVVPQIPYGTITALVASLAALGGIAIRKRMHAHRFCRYPS